MEEEINKLRALLLEAKEIISYDVNIRLMNDSDKLEWLIKFNEYGSN